MSKPPEERASANQLGWWRGRGAPSGRCVLLVEDDGRLVRALARVLEFDGHEVLVAGDADTARAFARERGASISVIVTDVLLPSGPIGELVTELMSECGHPPILFMSGALTHEGALPELSVRTHFLPKPFSPQELKAALRGLCEI
jgi:two-component system cell cycle sensor histidine kinase/response regulator CckA